jgi:uncharacterized membrane protein
MTELLVLRLVHVVGGTLWVGAMLFNVAFVMPALAEAGPAARPVMASLQRRRLFVVMPIIALLTILSGLRMMWHVSAGFSRAYFATPTGATFGLAGAAAIIAFIIGITIVRPAGVRAGVLAQSLGTVSDPAERTRLDSELKRLQQRTITGGWAVSVLLLLSAAGMAIGQYVR